MVAPIKEQQRHAYETYCMQNNFSSLYSTYFPEKGDFKCACDACVYVRNDSLAYINELLYFTFCFSFFSSLRQLIRDIIQKMQTEICVCLFIGFT